MKALEKGTMMHEIAAYLTARTDLDGVQVAWLAAGITNIVEQGEREMLNGKSRTPWRGDGLFNLVEDNSVPPGKMVVFGGRRFGKGRLMDKLLAENPEWATAKVKPAKSFYAAELGKAYETPADNLVFPFPDTPDAQFAGWAMQFAESLRRPQRSGWTLKPRSGDMHQVADAERASVMQPVRKEFLG